ncbi:MAG: UDP-N-acetylmuramoyl-L-alanine--D-glutamate ligase [Bacteroidota bacterium]
MVDFIRQKYSNKSIVLLGFGREGQSSYALLRKIFPDKHLNIADANTAVSENPIVCDDKNLSFFTGPGYLNQLNEFDVIFRSPGIPIWKYIKQNFQTSSPSNHSLNHSIPREKITSQTELFLQYYAKQVIGITGTKGKSTTSSLINHILSTAGKDSLLVGNIGNPPFHFLDLITPDTKIVFELSSHQLEFIRVAPHISVLLNLFQEHLDAYASYEDYQLAKLNITKFQQPDDWLVFNIDDQLLAGHVQPYQPLRKSYPFSVSEYPNPGGFIRDGWICFSNGMHTTPVWKIHQDRFLRGEHNLKNILAAVNVAMICGIAPGIIEEGIATFKGLEHRMEWVGEFGKIHFYNDSIATIPEACMAALKAIPKVDTLIAGGFDRGIDYSELAVFLCASDVRNLILLGAAGKRIGENLRKMEPNGKRIFYINRFDDFCSIAFRETLAGYACLLSPAAASYDEFKNFEERGKRFRALVNQK